MIPLLSSIFKCGIGPILSLPFCHMPKAFSFVQLPPCFPEFVRGAGTVGNVAGYPSGMTQRWVGLLCPARFLPPVVVVSRHVLTR